MHSVASLFGPPEANSSAINPFIKVGVLMFKGCVRFVLTQHYDRTI